MADTINLELSQKMVSVQGLDHYHEKAMTEVDKKMKTISGATIDGELSDSSENAVQNKIVKNALDGKADSEHTHDNRYYTETEINDMLKSKANTSDIPSSLPANGGNADTVDGKHASDFASIMVLTTQEEVDSELASGIYSVERVPVVFGGVSVSFFVLIVNKFSSGGYNSEIALPYDHGIQIGAYYRNCNKGTWGAWTNIADGGNAAEVNGYSINSDVPANAKFTDTNTVTTAYCTTASATAAKIAYCTGYVFDIGKKSYTVVTMCYANTAASALTLNINGKGTCPIYINGKASSASNYTLPAGTYIVYFDGTNYHFRTDGYIPGSATGAYSATSANSTANTASARCLRNLSSGTEEATSANCPVGCWYGKHD